MRSLNSRLSHWVALEWDEEGDQDKRVCEDFSVFEEELIRAPVGGHAVVRDVLRWWNPPAGLVDTELTLLEDILSFSAVSVGATGGVIKERRRRWNHIFAVLEGRFNHAQWTTAKFIGSRSWMFPKWTALPNMNHALPMSPEQPNWLSSAKTNHTFMEWEDPAKLKESPSKLRKCQFINGTILG